MQPVKPQRKHYQLALASITTVVIVGTLLWWKLPILRYSAITASAELVLVLSGRKYISTIYTIIATDIMLFLLWRTLSKYRDPLRMAAMREEKMFRAGAENWNMRQRMMSNLVFGGVHLINLYVPLVGVISLATGGWWFMWCYRRAYRESSSRIYALEQSSAFHAAHNKLVLTVLIPLAILGWITYLLLS